MTFVEAFLVSLFSGIFGYALCMVNVTRTIKQQGSKVHWYFGPWRVW